MRREPEKVQAAPTAVKSTTELPHLCRRVPQCWRLAAVWAQAAWQLSQMGRRRSSGLSSREGMFGIDDELNGAEAAAEAAAAAAAVAKVASIAAAAVAAAARAAGATRMESRLVAQIMMMIMGEGEGGVAEVANEMEAEAEAGGGTRAGAETMDQGLH